MFPTISGNLLLARSNPRNCNYIGLWNGNGTFAFTDFHRFSAPAFLLFINTDDTKTQPGFGAPLEGGGLLIHPALFVLTTFHLF